MSTPSTRLTDEQIQATALRIVAEEEALDLLLSGQPSLYAIRRIGERRGPVKIGFTSVHPQRRLWRIQRDNPAALEVFKVWPGGDAWAERAIHYRLQQDRIPYTGEWYRWSSRVALALESEGWRWHRIRLG